METKVIVITGSTRGIGLGMATEFLKRGHHVAINGTSQKSVDVALEKLSMYSSQLIGIPGSVTKLSTHERLFDQTCERFGKVDIWINNAGITTSNKMTVDLDKKAIKDVYDINIKGMTLGTLLALRKMKDQGYGKIFNMEGFGSDGRMMPKMTIYGTSKYAVRYFTRSMAREVEGSPVQIGALSPGMVITDLIINSMDKTDLVAYEQTKKIFNILGEKVETVTPFLVEGLLKSTKNNDRIAYLSGLKVMWKFLKSRFKKNEFFK
ncbi:MAG: SDR family NAD(P)-dependent oxidoreductase [Prolixibacteraceae bacterium]